MASIRRVGNGDVVIVVHDLEGITYRAGQHYMGVTDTDGARILLGEPALLHIVGILEHEWKRAGVVGLDAIFERMTASVDRAAQVEREEKARKAGR